MFEGVWWEVPLQGGRSWWVVEVYMSSGTVCGVWREGEEVR